MVRRVGEREHRVAVTGEALVELHYRATERWLFPLERTQCLRDVARVSQVLETERACNAGSAKHSTTAALGAEKLKVGIARVEWNVERDGE